MRCPRSLLRGSRWERSCSGASPASGVAVWLAAGYALVAAETLRRHPPSVALATPAVAAAHHVAYGTAFLRGLLGGRISR